ncbi:endonuclease [Candidatus Woesearchaeota archaeon]|nr:endonuclease [Candidatus Woesearchaeota archaeon]
MKKIYEKLYSYYGPQKWWPIIQKKPTKQQKISEIIIGTILTQNTSWKNVEKALNNLNKNHLLSFKNIKKTKTEKLARLIKSSGYYNQKADRLKLIADFYINNDLTKLSTEQLRNKLLTLKGVGNETADSILLYAFNRPIFVIDSYTKRIFSRMGFCNNNITYEELQNLFMQNLKKDIILFKEYHALLVKLAKEFCKNKPLCKKCIFSKSCKKLFK